MSAIEATIMEQIPVVPLEVRRDTLATRLEAGFNKIEEAAEQGKNVERWEDAWLKLLGEYEDVCNQIERRQFVARA